MKRKRAEREEKVNFHIIFFSFKKEKKKKRNIKGEKKEFILLYKIFFFLSLFFRYRNTIAIQLIRFSENSIKLSKGVEASEMEFPI